MLQKFSCTALLRKKEKKLSSQALRQKLLVREEENKGWKATPAFTAGFQSDGSLRSSLGFGMGQFSWNMLLLNSKRLDVFMQINS